MGYDIVGDIHGHPEKLEALLKALRYERKGGLWKHPERQAIFVGDFIDKGARGVEVVSTVRAMVEAGAAQAVMGNHELNAIAWHTPVQSCSDEFLRPHIKNNRDQHQAFLAQVEDDSDQHKAIIDWFLTLPLWIDLPGLRVVHACWHPPSIEFLSSRLKDGCFLTRELMPEAVTEPEDPAEKDTPELTIFKAVEILLKGIEIPLPAGFSFQDRYTKTRNRVRTEWWNASGATYRDLANLDDEIRHGLPELVVPAHQRVTTAATKPTFFGHYWMSGAARVQSDACVCVDYSAGKEGPLAAYRWSEGEHLNARNFTMAGKDMDWFERITGFREDFYQSTQGRLREVDGRLISNATDRTYGVGRFETPTLAELRVRARSAAFQKGATRVDFIQGDARELHADPKNAGALFQVASQFNALEMIGSDVTPEHGITRYAADHTQGPACAIAAGAGTIFRNYLVPLDGQMGQTASHQIDCLRDIGEALGNHDERLWRMRNGYCLTTDEGLAAIDERLAALDARQRDDLKSRLRIGLHWNVEVTDAGACHRVSQAYCSALPAAYNHHVRHRHHWDRFATLILEAAYEATMLAAVLNRDATGNSMVFLTSLGGGAFGNDPKWIAQGVKAGLDVVQDAGLDVRIVSFRNASPQLLDAAQRYLLP